MLLSYSIRTRARSLPLSSIVLVEYVNAKRWIQRLDKQRSYVLVPWPYIRDVLLAPKYRNSKLYDNLLPFLSWFSVYAFSSVWNVMSEPASLFYSASVGALSGRAS